MVLQHVEPSLRHPTGAFHSLRSSGEEVLSVSQNAGTGADFTEIIGLVKGTFWGFLSRFPYIKRF
jgi:hypothetical protein